jgi:hypothetical protein
MKRISRHATYANVVATLALCFAVSGGAAYAASHYLITSTKQIKPGVLKQLAGKAGPPGAPGPVGPSGPQGPAGAAGPKGETGPAGTPGKEGAPGSEGKQGKEGKPGKEGSPWSAGGTLPSGRTETGVWSSSGGTPAPISFSIPLAEPLAWSENQPGEPENQVHYINPSGKEVFSINTEIASHPACPGTVAKPEATPGNLCIYASSSPTEGESGWNEAIVNAAEVGPAGAAISGALLLAEGHGTWAVTAK